MPAIARAHGVNVDPRRIYAFGGSMGGQETLLLAALHPRLLAGAAAFDPATDMRRRYFDFAALKGGAVLQRLAREEVGGTPWQDPRAYARRSPDHYVRRLAFSGVPLQIFWSTRDRIISDQSSEAGALSSDILRLQSAGEALGVPGRVGSHSRDAVRPAVAARARALRPAAVARRAAGAQ